MSVPATAEHEDTSPPFDDLQDFESASRGFIDAVKPCVIKHADGRVMWNNDEYDFLQGECPPTVNPKLWRQSQLCAKQGLFEITDGIYQIRGVDIANMTIVEGQTGIIVIDPLVSIECAEVALALYRKHRGDREVTAVMYSHSHLDHFGGAQGVLRESTDTEIPIIAPDGFMQEATSENIYAGPSMRRRAAYMYGINLPRAPDGQIGVGIGTATSTGTTALIPPNVLIKGTREERVVDGVKMVFQMVSGTEAPSEFNFFLPQHRTLYIAECAAHGLHNITTLRGALVRDAKSWSMCLDESAQLFGRDSDVLCSGHTWPTWGSENIVKFISEQRDLYAYLHDQTIRLMNLGLTGIEIAETLTLPPSLQSKWHTQGFYGSISHNVMGIYQRYMTWFDGNPAHLWQHPPTEEGRRYVACMGGVHQVIKMAGSYAEDGDLRFAATLLDHAVRAAPDDAEAQNALAHVYEKLGHGAENSTWRNFYLVGAQNLRRGIDPSTITGPRSIDPSLSLEQLFGAVSVTVDGPRAAAAGESFDIDIHVVDEQHRWRLTLNNGALTYRSLAEKENWADAAGLSLETTKSGLLEALRGRTASIYRSAHGATGLWDRLLALTASSVELEAKQ